MNSEIDVRKIIVEGDVPIIQVAFLGGKGNQGYRQAQHKRHDTVAHFCAIPK